MFQIMDEKGIKAREICSLLQIKENTLSSWKVRNKDPEARDIFALCEYLGVSCEYLLTGTETSEGRSEGGSFDREDLELLRLIQQLPHDAKIEFRGEIKGYLKGLAASGSLEEPAEMKQAK
jgi:transcriptional regulator with XRE-family HTH domain